MTTDVATVSSRSRPKEDKMSQMGMQVVYFRFLSFISLKKQ